MRSTSIAAFALTLACTSLVTSAVLAQTPLAAPEKIAVGDWQLAPTLEVRTHGEYRRDSPDLGGLDLAGRSSDRVRDAWGVFERTSLGLGAEHGALRAQVTLRDARAYGTTFVGGQGYSAFGPYEAFIEAHSSSARPSYIRLGRQAVVWGEGQLVGAADWSPTGRSLDAARARLAFGDAGIELLAAILESPAPLGVAVGDTLSLSHAGVELYGVEGDWAIAPLLHLEAFGLARIARTDGTTLDGSRFESAAFVGERYTASLRASGEDRGWKYAAEGAYQLGTADALAPGGANIAAWAAYGHVEKRLDEVLLTPTIRIGGAYASGDDGGATYKQFDPLLADPHQYGAMDVFAWSNHIEGNARVTVVPFAETTFGLEYRYARLAQANGEWMGGYVNAIGRTTGAAAIVIVPSTQPASTASTDLGHELDATITWRPWSSLDLMAGYSAYLFGDGARTILAAMHRGAQESDGTFAPANLAQFAFMRATLRIP